MGDIVDAFEDLVDDDIPQSLVTYFENNYIGHKRGRGARMRRLEPPYPIRIWNVHSRCMAEEPHTINGLEAFHSGLNSMVSAIHPNIWTLLDVLRCKESLVRSKMQKFLQGDFVLMKKKYRDLDSHILKLIEKYDLINKLQFLKGVAHNLKFLMPFMLSLYLFFNVCYYYNILYVTVYNSKY